MTQYGLYISNVLLYIWGVEMYKEGGDLPLGGEIYSVHLQPPLPLKGGDDPPPERTGS